MRRLRIAALLLSAALAHSAEEVRAQTCPAISLTQTSNPSLESPVFVTHAGDGTNRLFVVEQPGTIRVIQPGSMTPTLFLRIPVAKILWGGERGLLGLAFHPNFVTNRRYFVNYTAKNNGRTVIAEYKASAVNPNVSEPSATNATETVLLTIPQPFANHNGGSLAFGPDGFLYVASGDGGSADDPGNRAQNVNALLGKILRIDVDTPNGPVPYSSPADNPYAGPTTGRDEIYAIGLRNPWRISFDRLTGQLLAGDVGQGGREEVSIITLGGNYGWRVMEGTRCNIPGDPLPCDSPAFTPPAFVYSHGRGRCSVTGGYVYRGSAGTLPDGTYVFGDYCTGEIFGIPVGDLPFDPGSLPAQPPVLRDTTLFLSSFGEDEAGELYAVGHGGSVERLTSSIGISPQSESFGSLGGSGTVGVTSPGACPAWSAAANDPWITIVSGEEGTGNGSVVYSVAANPDVPARSGTMTIAGRTFEVDQEGGPAPMLSVDDATVVEGPGAQATFTVTLSMPSSDTVLVDYTATGGTTSESDFVPASDTLTFAPGQTTKPVTIEINDDALDEDDETFFLVLSSAVGAGIDAGGGAGTITDDDSPPSLAIADASLTEGFGVRRVAIAVTLDAPSGRTVTVDYSIGAGTATAGADFRAETGSLEFLPGQTSETLFLWTKGDRVDEPNETVFVNLQGPVNATIANPQATLTIVDDDPPPRPRSSP